MGKLNIDKLRERLEELNNRGGSKSGSNMSWLNIKDGRNVLRIMPPAKGSEDFYVEVLVHYGVGKSDTNKNGSMVVCPTTHGEDKKCPVCESAQELRKLSKAKDDYYDKQARTVARKKRVYWNAISRDEDLSKYEKNEDKWVNTATGEEETPVKVLGTGVGILKDVINFIIDPEYGDITDAEQGLDLIITRTGTGFNTNYDVKTVRKESPIGFDLWEESMHDLSVLTKAKTYDEIATIMYGEKSDEELDKDVDKEMDTLPPKKEETETQAESTPNSEADIQAEIAAALAKRKKK